MKGLEPCNTAELKGWTGLRLLSLEIDRREGRSPGSAEVVVTSLESWLLWYPNSQRRWQVRA